MNNNDTKIFLEAGEGILTKKSRKITTILGSCLSITMFHRESGYAGMSHSLYPTCGKEHYGKLVSDESFKYVDCSFKKLTDYFLKKEIDISDVEIKIFGGGEVLEGNYENYESIGRQNINMIEQILTDNEINIKAADIGGKKGRKIIFDTSNGDVFLKKLE